MGRFEVRAQMKIREGQLEGFKRQAAEMMRQAREKDTGTVAYDWFLSADGTRCEIRQTYVDADAFVEHARHIGEARDTLFDEFAYDHKMAIYGDREPRVVELLDRVEADVTWFTLLQALQPVRGG